MFQFSDYCVVRNVDRGFLDSTTEFNRPGIEAERLEGHGKHEQGGRVRRGGANRHRILSVNGQLKLPGRERGKQLLAFARRQVLTAKPTDLNTAVSGMSDMLRRTIGEHGVELRTVLAPSLWPALVDATQIEVAILNLSINARDAMPLGGRVVIATRNIPAGTRDLPPELRAGDYVLVSVTDSGEGMAPETLAKAFDPFFTTKEVGRGTGLGLSQVYGLARQSGGTARIRSTLGQGTTAEIYLPRAAALSTETSAEPETASSPSHHRTVLVADDQDDVREVIVAHLDALGYRCVAASSGSLALDLLAGGNIDILLVDYAMPGFSGIEVIRAARETRPGLAVVLTTGYAQGEVLRDRLERVRLGYTFTPSGKYNLAGFAEPVEVFQVLRP